MKYYRFRFSTLAILEVNFQICSNKNETKYLSRVYSEQELNKMFGDMCEQYLHQEAIKLAKIMVKNNSIK